MAGEAPAPDPAETARALLRSLDLQGDLPGEEPPSPEHPFLFNFHLSPELFQILSWTLLLVGVAVILWALRDRLFALVHFDRAPETPATEAAVDASARRMEETQFEADELAARGLFVEAIHAMLLRALAELRRRLDLSFGVSLTSREILAAAPISEKGRAAFGVIVFFVERTHFGGADASGADYAECRRHFDALRLALAEGARP
jgi:hypothetical protein